ncbi:MAG: hypothetical protein NWF08_04775 [Candidatus Bathyarchaeota archaeon]|nr:hypothetical protein [Candidatus Bathyarchaeota archaeon]
MKRSEEKLKEYYRDYMRDYYGRNKEYWQNYYAKKRKTGKGGRKKASIASQKHIAKLRDAWFGRDEKGSIKARSKASKSNWNKLTRLVSKEILPAEGFTNIKILNPSNKGRIFLFDILAINGENKCGIICTTSYVKILAKTAFEKLKLLLDFFNIEMHVCFVKPNLSKYYLMRFDGNKSRTIMMGLKRIPKMKAVPEI